MMNRKMRHIIYGIGLFLLLPAASCTERTLEVRPDPVPIRLYAGIRTRALVDAFEATPVNIACGLSSGGYAERWDGVATAGEIRLVPERYYPDDGSRLYLRGYYPPAPFAADGTLTYTLTGDEDLLLSDEQSASLSSPFTDGGAGRLMYSHLLVKLNFMIQMEDGNTSSLRVRALTLNGLASRVTLALSTGALSYGSSTTSVVIYSAPDGSEGLPFVDDMLQFPGYVLVQPRADFTLDMVLSIDNDRSHDLVYEALPIIFEGGTGEGGTAYTVHVKSPVPTFPDPLPVRVIASVVPWHVGDSGSGNIPGWER
ncbi:fimbrillin family protein [Bacteroides timonensis]|uniref:fimbrillin family protein n=1 Tax=Bacteroides timonensis TaxID=1470345 RepID=UPI001FCB93C9|nr:fimbrillin family protein [Bacteroides timonensis]